MGFWKAIVKSHEDPNPTKDCVLYSGQQMRSTEKITFYLVVKSHGDKNPTEDGVLYSGQQMCSTEKKKSLRSSSSSSVVTSRSRLNKKLNKIHDQS